MSKELATTEQNQTALMESVLIAGDLSKLTPGQRTQYYMETCNSLGLNPLTRPFDYISLNGKLTLYARKDCTDQLRNLQKVSLEIKSREVIGDVYVVSVKATTLDGRYDESTGVVNIKGLTGDALANQMMKCESKGKRRVTLSLCGLGFTDESEVETIPGAHSVQVDMSTGEILDAPTTQTARMPEPKDETPTQKQCQISHILGASKFGTDKQNKNSRNEFLDYCSDIAQRTIKSTKELTKTEISQVIDELNGLSDYVELPDPNQTTIGDFTEMPDDPFENQ